MPSLWITPAAVRRLAERLVHGAAGLDRSVDAIGVGTTAADMPTSVPWHVADRADRFRRAAARLVDAVERIERHRLEVDGTGRHSVRFADLAAMLVLNQPLLLLHNDRGETLRPSARGPAPSSDDALHALALLLGTTGDRVRIGEDEFGIVDHGEQRYTVLLPGVIDLSRPRLGLDRAHRSVRDVDQAAFESFLHDGTAANAYADLVARFLLTELPAGSEVVVIGHSYGADTAADLAADPRIGPDSVAITHALLAGYDSEPQLPGIPADIEVLVLRNEHDLVASIEAWVRRLPGRLWPGGTAPTSRPPTHRVVHFDGGEDDFGHHQRHYVAAIEAAGHPDVVAFATSVADRRPADGELWAIDVSVPEDGP